MAALQFDVAVRNARADAIEVAVGASPIIELRSGPKPANCAAASSGSLLARDALPADWLADAASGVLSKLGTWTLTGLAGIAATEIGYFRIFSAGSPDVCRLQGNVTLTGGAGPMIVDGLTLEAGQTVTITQFDITEGNA